MSGVGGGEGVASLAVNRRPQQRQMFPAEFRIKLLLSLNINLNRKKYIKNDTFFGKICSLILS